MARRIFSREFKIEAVRLVRERGVSVAQAARDLDIHENMLRRWAKERTADPAQAFPGHGRSKPEQLEIERLRREVAKLRAERDMPQKRPQPSSRGKPDEVRFHREAPFRLAGVVALRSAGRIAVRLSRLAASRAERPGAIRRATDGEGPDELCRQRPHLWRAPGLARCPAEGAASGLHKIERLMRANAFRARPRRRGLPKDDGQRSPVAAPNVLDWQFAAERPNQKWIAGFTYVWTAEGWLYVAAVIDLFSRRLVGWSMKAEMTAHLVTDALMMAIRRRGKPDALLHHSDQGSQYSSEQFQRLMVDNGVVCSMSRSGNVWDNAAMESFFSSLKTERIGKKVYRTRDAARADVFDYIERFYNTVRRHSTIGSLSPVEFERKVGLA
jgi:putative transposase